MLSRYARGGGILYDMEFLESEKRRVAAFGYHAGYAGAALALQAWARQMSGMRLEGREPYAHKSELDDEVRRGVREAMKKFQRGYPTALIIGALGRCGRGAIEMCREAGLPDGNLMKWDMAETAKGGPFEEIREADVSNLSPSTGWRTFCNAIFGSSHLSCQHRSSSIASTLTR